MLGLSDWWNSYVTFFYLRPMPELWSSWSWSFCHSASHCGDFGVIPTLDSWSSDRVFSSLDSLGSEHSTDDEMLVYYLDD